jgi:hypothetical protein
MIYTLYIYTEGLLGISSTPEELYSTEIAKIFKEQMSFQLLFYILRQSQSEWMALVYLYLICFM